MFGFLRKMALTVGMAGSLAFLLVGCATRRDFESAPESFPGLATDFDKCKTLSN